MATAGVIACSLATTAYLLLGRPASGGVGAVPLGIAVAGYLVALRHRRGLRTDIVTGCIAVALVAAVVVPPRTSRDYVAYAVYGRIAAVHDANPYVHDPGEYPNDPMVRRILYPPWLTTSTIYGPFFTAVSAAGMRGFRSHLAIRLFFQTLAAAAVALSLLLLWRRTRDPAVLCFAGLNPVVAASVVNGGHNDALLGLAVLVAALCLSDRRFAAAGLALGIAASIKFVALLALVAAMVWTWKRAGLRRAVRVAVPGAVVFVVGYALVGPLAALDAIRESARVVMPYTAVGTIVRAVAADAQPIALALSGILVLILAGALVARAIDHEQPAVFLALPFAAYILAGGYVLPWYVAWALPLVALSASATTARVVAAAGLILTVFYWPASTYPGSLGGLFTAVARTVLPLAAIAGAVFLVRERERRGMTAAFASSSSVSRGSSSR